MVAETTESDVLAVLDGPGPDTAETPDIGPENLEEPQGPKASPVEPQSDYARLIAPHIPDQSNGWSIPSKLRVCAIAELWRVIRSRRLGADMKIRAIEALVRLDAQALNQDRAEDWRAVQQSKAKRGNVRVLAELAKAKSLPKVNKG